MGLDTNIDTTFKNKGLPTDFVIHMLIMNDLRVTCGYYYLSWRGNLGIILIRQGVLEHP